MALFCCVVPVSSGDCMSRDFSRTLRRGSQRLWRHGRRFDGPVLRAKARLYFPGRTLRLMTGTLLAVELDHAPSNICACSSLEFIFFHRVPSMVSSVFSLLSACVSETCLLS